MNDRTMFRTIAVVSAVVLTGCSQNKVSTDNTLPQNGEGSVTTTRIIDGHVVTQTDTRRTTVDPLPQDSQVQLNPDVNGYGAGSPDADGQGDDRRVRLRAPMVNLNVDRDSGSVHVHTPFVRIDKDGTGEGTQINIPRIRVEDSN